MAAARPQIMGPGEDDDDVEVTRETVAARKRAEEAAARRRARESMTRRSWYTTTEAADAFEAAVEEIYLAHRTRVPKHQIIAALLAAAAEQAGDVERRLAPVGRVRPVRRVRPLAPPPGQT